MNKRKVDSLIKDFNSFIYGINSKLKYDGQRSGTPYINVNVTRHSIERALERNVSLQHFGSNVKLLLNKHYCELIYLVLSSKEATVSVTSLYKTTKLVFKLKVKEDGNINCTPVTTLKRDHSSSYFDGFIFNVES